MIVECSRNVYLLENTLNTDVRACVRRSLQDQVEEADGCGPGAAGGGGELLGPPEDVPVTVLLPTELGV